MKSDDELAAVLAHEIAHVLANHAMEDKSIMTAAGVFSLPFVPFALFGLLVPEFFLFAIPIGFAIGATYTCSRKRETEADYIGMMLMADAGFDPLAAVNVVKKGKEMEDQILSADPKVKQDPQWISTHPHVSQDCSQVADGLQADERSAQSASRIRKNENWIPEILEILGKPSADAVAVRSADMTAKRRRWENFVKKRNESQSIDSGI